MAGSRTNSGENLKREWRIPARQVRYSKGGKWYTPLEKFPGAFADNSGYILFTRETYKRCSQLQIGARVNVAGGIATIPGYIRKAGSGTKKASAWDESTMGGWAEGVVDPRWSKWVKVAHWLDRGADAGLKPPDRYGVYRFRVRSDHPALGEKLLYVGSTSKRRNTLKKPGKVGKNVDNFTGLRRRMWEFVSSALGFGMETNPGCRICGPELKLSARDLEVSWAEVACPKCVEHEVHFRANPAPLLNRNTPPRCNREDCPCKG